MLETLQLYDSVLVKYMLHSTYLILRYAVDIKVERSHAEGSRIDAEFAERTAFVQHELMHMDKRLFASYAKEQP